jgi:uncharacterized protein involved in exopolysaccharide biosynthesis
MSPESPPVPRRAEVSVLELGTILLRRRRLLFMLGLLGAALGGLVAFLGGRSYGTRAVFMPHESQSGVSELALAASQLGLQVPGNASAGWVPAVYVELINSRVLLEPIALDTFVIAEEGGRRAELADLLGVNERDPARRSELAVQALRNRIRAQETRGFSAVSVTAYASWPSVSHGIVERLLASVSEFNLNKRKSQAVAERTFVEGQLAAAETEMRTAEERLKEFLEGNRGGIDRSPELTFQRNQLEREMLLRQELRLSLFKSLEEARIREVRDTPVMTVLEEPRLPGVPEPRGFPLRVAVGLFAGLVLASGIAFLSHLWADAKRVGDADTKEFLQLVQEASPRFLTRRLN